MANLSEKQTEYLDGLLNWIHSIDTKQEVFNLVCNELDRLIKMNSVAGMKQRAELLVEILAKEKNAYHGNSNESLINNLLDRAASYIETHRKYKIIKASLFDYINNISGAKQFLKSLCLRYLPTADMLDEEIKNRKLIKDIEHLTIILDKWIVDLTLTGTYSKSKLLAIQAKYARYKEEFELNKTMCSICVLAQYIDNPTEAKLFLSEIFTRKQEEFYSSLEHWAKEEIEDKQCSRWISSYLYKGRDLRIGRIQVLRYVDNLQKAKDFLLGKYKQKLDRDLSQKQAYENKRRSLFDNYEKIGSVNSLLPGLSAGKLYSTCVSSNDAGKLPPLSIMSCKNGFTIKKDCINIGGFVYNLTIKATNPLYYLYTSTYRKHTRYFTFLTPFALEVVKRYSSMYLDKNLADKTQACLIVREADDKKRIKSYMCFLTSEEELYNPTPKYIYDFSNVKASNYHDKVGYRYVFKALLWHLLKDNTCSIDFDPTKDFSENERQQILQFIDKHHDNMSYENKTICHFMNYIYGFPTDSVNTPQQHRKYFQDRIINLSNCVSYHYDTQVFEDRFFEFSKVYHQYGDTTFRELTSSIGDKIHREDFIDIWFNVSNSSFLQNLRSLLFINWVYVGNEYVSVKWISACWLLPIILEQYKNGYDRDRGFWTLLLAYILIENDLVYNALILNLLDSSDESQPKIRVSSIVKSLLTNKDEIIKHLLFNQKSFLSHNIYKSTLFEDYLMHHDYKEITLKESVSVLECLCTQINITPDDFSNSNLHLNLIDTVKFKVPSNFTYYPTHSHTPKYYYNNYRGTYARDVAGYSPDEIDIIFDGDPNAYWNID